MENPIISIILPSLNVVEYIRECVESVLNQNLKNVEILCVDAGSTDGTLEILQEYAEKDSRVQVICSDKKSYGYQMNLGLKAAKGKYIGIVETDDYVKPDMYETLCSIADKHQLDFIKADFYRFTHDTSGELVLQYNQLSKNREVYGKVVNPQEDISLFNLIMNTWSGIYNRQFLLTNNIYHNETPGASYQDNGFWFQTFALATRVYFVNTPYYMNRRDNPNSSVHSKGKVYCMNEEYEYIQRFIDAHPERKQKLMPIYCFKKYHNYMFTYNRIAEEFKLEYAQRFSEEMKQHLDAGELDKSMFSERIWNVLQTIINDPMQFYFENSKYSNSLTIEVGEMRKKVEEQAIMIAYQETLIDGFLNSSSYRIGRVVTLIPRKLKAALNYLRSNGLKATLRKIKETLLK